MYDVHPSAAEIRDEVDTGLALLEALRAAPADLDWFYVSPPRDFGAWAPAPTTGSYRLSDDVLLVDDEGGSTISADDLALAVLDEVVPQPRPTSAPPNSLDAAAGFNALRNAAPEREAELLSAIQRAWYRDGHSLSDPATYAQIARGFGLDGDAVAADAASQAARDQARREFTTADELGVHECPTLLLTVDGDTRRLGGPVTKAEPLIQQFETAVAGSA